MNAPATRRDARRVLVDTAAEARTLSMSQLSRDAEAAADTATTAAVLAGSFTRDGAVWTLEFAAEIVRMRDAKGLRDLATLLATPGRPVAAADLMAAGAGLSGGPRRLGDQWERARKAVTARIRDIIDRIDAVHPELASHLRESVTTGTHCTYSPAPVTWRL